MLSLDEIWRYVYLEFCSGNLHRAAQFGVQAPGAKIQSYISPDFIIIDIALAATQL